MEPEYNGFCSNCSGLFRKNRLKKNAGEYLGENGKKVFETVYKCQKCNYTVRYSPKKTKIPLKIEAQFESKKSIVLPEKLVDVVKNEKPSDYNSAIGINKQYPRKLPETLFPKKEIITTVDTKWSPAMQQNIIISNSTKPSFPLIDSSERERLYYKSSYTNGNIKIDWGKIIGYDEIKHIIDAALNNIQKKKTHILLCGAPGTSKTVFLLTILNSLKKLNLNVHYLDATTLSSSGVLEYMFSNDMDYCLLDELDKLKKEHQATFLNTLETGILQETKNKKIRNKDMKQCVFIVTANYQDKILEPLFTRMLTLLIPKYTKEQFYAIGTQLLNEQYGKTKEIAVYITDQVWRIYTEKRHEEPNLRVCRDIAILTDNDKLIIDPILQGITTYSKRYDD